jgi:hypothetical protein
MEIHHENAGYKNILGKIAALNTLLNEKKGELGIHSWTWVSAELSGTLGENYESLYLQTFGKQVQKIFGRDVSMYAVMPNVFDVMYQDFFKAKHYNWKSDLSVVEQLYRPGGS